MDLEIRTYERERDAAAIARTWRELGWIEPEAKAEEALGWFLDAGEAEVGVVDGEAEALAHRTPGTIRYQDVDLPLCAVTAVTTSHLARKRGLATTLTARALAAGHASGAAVAALGQFEQGFYDRLGFGSAAYVHLVRFDPASLRVEDVPYRTPVRLTRDDHADVHDLLLRRHRTHGGVTLHPPGFTRAGMAWKETPFGLGLRDASGRLTHAVFGEAKGVNGPYSVTWLAYEEPGQVLEVLRLLRELGDQVAAVEMAEPGDVQLLDLLTQPFRHELRTKGSEHETGIRAKAWWQLRILDLPRVVAARRWGGPPLHFALTLTDPLAGIRGAPWAGIGGDYVITVGEVSEAAPGAGDGLPRLTASVNAFSRMWFAVRPASGLALTDTLAGTPDLLRRLDEALALPPPVTGLWF